MDNHICSRIEYNKAIGAGICTDTLHQFRSRPFAAENATPEYEYRSATKVAPALSKALPPSKPCHNTSQHLLTSRSPTLPISFATLNPKPKNLNPNSLNSLLFPADSSP